jgi:hypothetical protein
MAVGRGRGGARLAVCEGEARTSDPGAPRGTGQTVRRGKRPGPGQGARGSGRPSIVSCSKAKWSARCLKDINAQWMFWASGCHERVLTGFTDNNP